MNRKQRVLLIAIAIALVTAAAEVVVLGRITRSLPPPSAVISTPPTLTLVPGPPPSVPLPAAGSLLLESDLSGVLAAKDADVVRPIASMAKAMTAYVVLQAHALDPGAAGPSLTMTAADVQSYQQELEAGGSTVAVRVVSS